MNFIDYLRSALEKLKTLISISLLDKNPDQF